MFNGMLCPDHKDPVERIVDTDFRTIIEEHPDSTFTRLEAMDTDYSIIELITDRIGRWLTTVRK